MENKSLLSSFFLFFKDDHYSIPPCEQKFLNLILEYIMLFMELIDRYRGCLIGGASGDALGYPVEFMSMNSIKSKYGKHGIVSYELNNGIAEISDDTQMTLFTATGILIGITRAKMRGISAKPWDYIRYSYKDWYRTQTEKYPLNGYHYSWLDDVPELFSRRAPGSTCINALASPNNGTVENPINDSKGCGGVMRIAPIGLYFGRRYDIGVADYIGAEVATLTHGHSLGYIPAAALTHIIALVTHHDCSINEAVADMRHVIGQQYHDDKYIDYFLNLTRDAVDLANDRKICDADAIKRLGEGWVAEEALAIAIFCSLRYSNDFSKAIIAAVNHNGDSDSTGSITGNIIGAYLGLSGIPDKWISNLELKGIIMEIADDLFHDCQISEYGKEKDPEWEEKYFNCKAFRHK